MGSVKETVLDVRLKVMPWVCHSVIITVKYRVSAHGLSRYFEPNCDDHLLEAGDFTANGV